MRGLQWRHYRSQRGGSPERRWKTLQCQKNIFEQSFLEFPLVLFLIHISNLKQLKIVITAVLQCVEKLAYINCYVNTFDSQHYRWTHPDDHAGPDGGWIPPAAPCLFSLERSWWLHLLPRSWEIPRWHGGSQFWCVSSPPPLPLLPLKWCDGKLQCNLSPLSPHHRPEVMKIYKM